MHSTLLFFFFNDTATTEIYTLSLHDALPIYYHGPQCGCGKRGCIETMAAGPAIARKAQARLGGETGRKSPMLELAGGQLDAITSEIVGRAFEAGESLAEEILLGTLELVDHLLR